ncbi:MAG: arylsulfotransferase family protein [Solirubrobacterales bacterium]|nr:arylsulfotransferase family protein [Solirubrobacterales bacterium]
MRALLAGLASLAGAWGVLGLISRPIPDALRTVRAAHRAREAHAAGAHGAVRCVPSRPDISAGLAGARVTVSPGPGSRDASPATQISLLGAAADELTHVTVMGSRSGAHSGSLLAYSQGDGASFLPARPFVEGEQVSVHATLTSAGTSTPFAWGFTVAVPDRAGVAGGSSPRARKPSDYQSFHSRPDLKPPTVTVTAHAPGASPGELFLAPYSGPGQYGPMILDESGRLVWFKALAQGTRAADFRVQSYGGAPVLSWWQDPLIANGSSKSGLVIADSSYRTIAVVRAGNGYQPDLHEFQLTPQGTALITVFDGIDCDLRSVGGPADGAVADTLLQEVDVKTGLVRYEWHSLDHVALSESYASARHSSQLKPFDYFHINSIDVQPGGDLLVDARNTWAAYDVAGKTGKVRWRLEGKRSSFTMGAGTRTAWQHDARRQSDGTITFFDNGASPSVHRQSRAIQLALDTQRMRATLVREDVHATPIVAGSQGNVQTLAGGDWLVGWGEVPYVTEFAAAGVPLFDAHLPAGYESYRAYRLPWSGHPPGRPALAVGARSGAPLLYASWNGATAVSSWRALVGASAAALSPSTTAPHTGFETTVALPAGAGPYAAVQALDATGAVIGVSAAVRLPSA